MSRRTVSLLLALLVVTGACTRPESRSSTTTSGISTSAPTTTETTPTTGTAPSTGTTGNRPSIPSFPDDETAIPTDDEVVIGSLGNGLTYFVRENRAPGGRAQLRLAVRAGSLQESAVQRGAAHFLEHMAFNGTETYAANELVAVLQRFGAEFGPDINAHTSYEETVYELELPTAELETIATGIEVLHQWASAITLDPAEVELERGVLVEEWRLRDQGFWGRYFSAVSDVLLAGTEYEGKEPLGTPDEVARTTPDDLRDFYETWYRADTMAVVAVGDFDAGRIEDLIVDAFSDLAEPPDPEPVPTPTTSPATMVATLPLGDPEAVQTWVELNYPLPTDPFDDTIGALRRSMALDLAWTMIVSRLDEASLREQVPFWDPSFAANPLVRTQRSPGVAAYTDPQQMGATTEALLASVEQAAQHGFAESEVMRAITELRSQVQLEYDDRSSTQDREFADEYVQRFLGGTPIPSALDWFEVRMAVLDDMSADLVWATFADTIEATRPLVILVAPEQFADQIPDVNTVDRIARATRSTDHGPWVDETEVLETLMERPAAAGIEQRRSFSDTALAEIVLENGARVVLLPTTIREDFVVMRAASPGGWAPLPEGDVAEAQLAPTITLSSGVDGIEQVTLDRSLAGRTVSLTPYIDEVEEGFYGEVANRDIETLFQLIHLYMKAPRFEQVALDIAVAESIPYAATPEQSPEVAVLAAALDARYAGDPRFGVVPPEDELLSLDLDRAAAIYRDRFDDPEDFVFAFVGDFDEDELEDLARRYIGTIPASSETEGWLNVRPTAPDNVEERIVAAGSGVLGGLTLYFSTEHPLDAQTRVEIDLLNRVLQNRLTERIREELSASYSPFSYVELHEVPVETVDIWIQVSGDPEDLDAISTETLAVLQDLRSPGPSTDAVSTAAGQLALDYELFSNESLADALVFSAMHEDEPLTEIITRIGLVTEISPDQIRELANELLPGDRYIEVRLVPAG